MLTITRRMAGKLQGLWAINVSSLDNPFCKEMSQDKRNICSWCYSRKMLRGLRANCRPSMVRNMETLAHPLTRIPRIRDYHLFRFNAHGELVNRIHAANYFTIAKCNPHVTFAMWTKRPELVRGLIKPSNLFLVYSSPRIDVKEELPDGFDKVFTVWSKPVDGVEINCHGKRCASCKLCYSDGVESINELLRKR